jgi:hypothetical protein
MHCEGIVTGGNKVLCAQRDFRYIDFVFHRVLEIQETLDNSVTVNPDQNTE